MKTLHPSKTLIVLTGLGACLVFLLGAGAWHAVLQADPPGCSENEIACLFIPTRADYGIHLLSYALMIPLMAALFLAFSTWRKQQSRISLLSCNLSLITIDDTRLNTISASLGLKDKVHLLESEDCLSFCAGLISPRIFISTAVLKLLDQDQLEAVLLHEKCHLENRDPLRVLFGRLIVSALFFAPILKDIYGRFLIRKEIAADQFAIRQAHRRGIISALQSLLNQQAPIGTVDLSVGGLEALGYRIDFILGRVHAEPIPLSHIAVSSLAPALTLASFLAPLIILHP